MIDLTHPKAQVRGLHSAKSKRNWDSCAALAQLVRALVCGTRGPPFEPGRRYQFPDIFGESNTLVTCMAAITRPMENQCGYDSRQGPTR